MTIYKERSNGRWEYWTYCDNRRVNLTEAFVRKEIGNGANIVVLK